MRLLPILLVLTSMPLCGQALRDINYKYLYNSEEAFSFRMEPVRQAAGWTVLWELEVTDSSAQREDFVVRFEIRRSLGDREGRILQTDSAVAGAPRVGMMTGALRLPLAGEPEIIAARVTNTTSRRAWYFYSVLQPSSPVNGYLDAGGTPVLEKYVNVGTRVAPAGDSSFLVSYYNDAFPPATPAFAESAGKVSKGFVADSVFTLPAGTPFTPTEKGLYLFQHDTLSPNGFAARAERDYPRLQRLESIAGPLIYICTRQEFERIRQAGDDKRAFDRVILSVTGDAGRARIFMRNYFKRVEQANALFTSYKEGWKTDRGMIYIIFGTPTEVFRFADREVWSYKTDALKATFEFIRSSSLFDPDNFVLIRNKKFAESWYSMVDLWRNARF